MPSFHKKEVFLQTMVIISPTTILFLLVIILSAVYYMWLYMNLYFNSENGLLVILFMHQVSNTKSFTDRFSVTYFCLYEI